MRRVASWAVSCPRRGDFRPLARAALLALVWLAGLQTPAWALYECFQVPDSASAAFPVQSRLFSADLQVITEAIMQTGVVYVAGGCLVQAQAVPDMTTRITTGCTIAQHGTTATVATGNMTHSAAHATLNRIDLVSADNTGAKIVTTGTAAASPLPPTVPQSGGFNNVVLAEVYIPAADTAINANQIIDKRACIPTPGGGGGAGTGLSYITKVAEGTLSNEFALGSLATGLLVNTVTTGVPTVLAPTDDNIAVGNGTAWQLKALPTCSGGTDALAYNISTNTFSCNTIATAGTGLSYWTRVAEAGLSAETALGALGTGLIINTTTTGVPTIYAGGSCTNQFVTATSASGALTCTSPTLAGAQFANQGTTTTVLHGNAAGNPSFGAVVSADLNLTTTTCTNQFVSAISSAAAGTCTTDTLASAQHANQGTTTTLLHGNAAGNPSWTGVTIADHTATGTPSATTFLRGDNTWATPGGSGTVTTTGSPANNNLAKFSGATSITNTDLTGDVTTSGTSATTLANIPTATPMAGSLLATAIAAPGTPAAGKGSVYVDSTSKKLCNKDDAGVVTCTTAMPSVDVQVFNTGAAGSCPGTAATCWTKAAGVTMCKVFGCGSGGGGGGGQGAAAGAVRTGGGGGGGGYCGEMTFRASDLPATVAVTTGVAGTFGAGGSSAGGADAGGGNPSSFGTLATWLGGGGGAGNTAGASGGSGAGCTGAGVSVTAASGGAGGACVTAGAAAGSTNVGMTGHGAPSANAAVGGVAGNYAVNGGGSGAGSTTAGAVTTLAGGSAWVSGAGGGAGGGVNAASPGTAEAGTDGGAVAWGLTTAGGGGTGGTVAACGSGGNGVAGAAGDFGNGGAGGGGGASINNATGCAGGAGGKAAAGAAGAGAAPQRAGRAGRAASAS